MFLLRKQAVGVYLPSLITNVIWATKPLSSCLLVFIFYPWCLAIWSATWKATGGSPGAQVALLSPGTAARGHGEGVEETMGAAGASALSMSCWNPQCCPGAGQAPGGDFFSERARAGRKAPTLLFRWRNAFEWRSVPSHRPWKFFEARTSTSITAAFKVLLRVRPLPLQRKAPPRAASPRALIRILKYEGSEENSKWSKEEIFFF